MATLFNNVANTLTTNFVPVQATFSASGGFLTFIGPGGVPFTTGGGSLAINTTAITGGTSGRVLYDNAGTVGELATTGTGSVVLSTSPTLSGTVNLSSLTASQAVFTNASKNLVSIATTGTGSVVLNSNPSFATDITVNGARVGLGTGTTDGSTALGVGALENNASGNDNTAIGNQTLYSTSNLGYGCTAVGARAARVGRGGYITAVGSDALVICAGDNNTAIGSSAGSTLSNGTGNTFVGYNALGGSPSSSNEIVIGAGITGSGDNTTTIGTPSTNKIILVGSLQAPGDAGVAIDIGSNQTTLPIYIGGIDVDGVGPTGTIQIGRGTNFQQITLGGNTNATTFISGKLKQQTYTVATLPTGSVGSRSFVTNALTPTFGATVVGGGAVGVPVYHDGTSWKVG